MSIDRPARPSSLPASLREEIAIATALQSFALWHMTRLRPGAYVKGSEAYRAARARYVESSQVLTALERYATPMVAVAVADVA